MEVAVEAANWVVGKVVNKLSDDLVAAYVASSELGSNFEKIKSDLMYTQGLLHTCLERGVSSSNPGLLGLLQQLSKRASEAEDALDELHYFVIQDKVDGTQEATPEVGHGLAGHALHACHAIQHAAGNWLSCLTCFHSQDDDEDAGKLPFNRVAMSKRIKHLIEDIHSLSPRASDLLSKNLSSSLLQVNMANNNSLERPAIGSTIREDKLYGRSQIFYQTIDLMTSGTHPETLSVLPIVGPGGIGKTTFAQHLYNDNRVKEHFVFKVWACVSTSFDVSKLTKEILSCMTLDEDRASNRTNEICNLDKDQKSIAERLKSKRFLIVLDDIWQCSEDKWVNFLAPFRTSEAKKGSMVIITTRFPNVAQTVKTTDPVYLQGLEPDEFWLFFQACVFNEAIAEHDREGLIEIGRQIANKLKCSPLAAKTVGRLLSKKPSREHWMEILEKEEWLHQKHGDDIIPALKISYDYLPFHLKKCFSYCALFPEDYKFDRQEISRFWISIGIIDSGDRNDKTEHIASTYLDNLLDNGFLMKGEGTYYVMHDLFHELSQSVSSEECTYISCSSFRVNDIPSSIRHLSISMKNNYIENFEEEMHKLKKRIDIGSLRSLMFFGEFRRPSVLNILKHTFKDVKCLRVLFIFMNSPNSLPHNFSKLVHLRYLKIMSNHYSEVCLPSTLSRFYHLKFLDLQHWGCIYDLPKDISRLINLRHFVAKKEFHSNVADVGKMKFLQELKEFHVKKESVGFELRELGKLEELGGELNIYGLQNVSIREEANEAKLKFKRNLIKLGLVWDRGQLSNGYDIIDNLQPHSNLRALNIVNHDCATGPSWLCNNIIYMTNLEDLHLERVSWGTLPPIGQICHLKTLKLKSIVGISQFGPDLFGGVTEKSFTHLKEVEFDNMPELVEWVGGANSHLFSRLEKIICNNCPKLVVLPFSGYSSSSKQDNTTLLPRLCHLQTNACPKLCLPPLPHTSMLSYFRTKCFDYDGTELYVKMPGELAFHNLGEVDHLSMGNESLVSFTDLQKLHPLRMIRVFRRDKEAFLRGLDAGVVLHSVQHLSFSYGFSINGKSLSSLLKCFPALSRLDVSSINDNIDNNEECVLQFPPSSSLRHVELRWFNNLILPVEDGGGFQGLSSLQSVSISFCDNSFSRWYMVEAPRMIHPFPQCLKKLRLSYIQSTLSVSLLSNLTSLTTLELTDCENMTADGFNPLITFNLEHLEIYNIKSYKDKPHSIAADLLSELARTRTMPAGSFQLVTLEVDSISAVLVAPICRHLCATLRSVYFNNDCRAEHFTEEQDEALQLLTSLQTLIFSNCRCLQSLPQGLHRHSSLEGLSVYGPHGIIRLPEKGLPSSLLYLSLHYCGSWLVEECEQLKVTRPDIDVYARPYTADY